jgi:hypothetical protein
MGGGRLSAGDCRGSSRRQQTDRQQADITRGLTRQGSEPATGQGWDDMATGMTRRRPAWAQMQRAVWDGMVTTGVVWQLDWLARRQHEGSTLRAAWGEHAGRGGVVTPPSALRGALGRRVARVRCGRAEIEPA